MLEVNPRASRTVPFASKATGVNLVDAACRLAAGATPRRARPAARGPPAGFHVKAAVLPFARFPGADPVLGPEMRSTGEVMASAADFATAFAKAERAAGRRLPTGGRAFLSVRDRDKSAVLPVARALLELGFELVATAGTASALADAGIPVAARREGRRRSCTSSAAAASTSSSTRPRAATRARDGYAIREAAVVARVPCITTLAVARAAVEAIEKALAEPARRSRSGMPQARAS